MSKTLPQPTVYAGRVNTKWRDAILAYGKTLPQQKTSYWVTYYEGIYFNLDLSEIEIVAHNDAEAVVIFRDYLNKNISVPYPCDNFDMENEYDSVEEFVECEFDNDTLWLSRKPPRKPQQTILTLSA